MFYPFLMHTSSVIAHRGGGLQEAENSWEAFNWCAREGFHYVETDAQLSRDGVVYLLHDESLDRVSNGRGQVCDYDSEELDRLLINGSSFPPVRLTRALRELEQIVFNIDAKTDAVLEPLVRTIIAEDAAARVVLASFNSARLKWVRRQYPQLATSLGKGEIARLVLASQGVPVSLPPAQVCFDLPVPGRPVAVQIPMKYRGISVLTRRLVALAHSRGWVVHVWTLNHPDEIVRALEIGADAIITDDPLLVREIVRARQTRPGG